MDTASSANFNEIEASASSCLRREISSAACWSFSSPANLVRTKARAYISMRGSPFVKWRSPPSSGMGPSMALAEERELNWIGDKGDERIEVKWGDWVMVVVVFLFFLLLLSPEWWLGAVILAEEGLPTATVSMLPLPLRAKNFHRSSSNISLACGLFWINMFENRKERLVKVKHDREEEICKHIWKFVHRLGWLIHNQELLGREPSRQFIQNRVDLQVLCVRGGKRLVL